MKEVKIHKAKIEKLDSDMAMLQKQIDELRKLSTKVKMKMKNLSSMAVDYDSEEMECLSRNVKRVRVYSKKLLQCARKLT